MERALAEARFPRQRAAPPIGPVGPTLLRVTLLRVALLRVAPLRVALLLAAGIAPHKL